ncbi:hypothetical protein PC129_g7879 [Phytophthora cactorum]|uniref:Uncharacterized protein n=1 Tax=Phytophthora cactorum TaxID=29920 RepID=A0A8T1I933_9STRA|nr:hypothetical protein PC114_g10664 [Phytophthora cactorum]KAG3221390.1 hypothetical protein PC129_g7879 [Phytophthora cactorum]
MLSIRSTSSSAHDQKDDMSVSSIKTHVKVGVLLSDYQSARAEPKSHFLSKSNGNTRRFVTENSISYNDGGKSID